MLFIVKIHTEACLEETQYIKKKSRQFFVFFLQIFLVKFDQVPVLLFVYRVNVVCDSSIGKHNKT